MGNYLSLLTSQLIYSLYGKNNIYQDEFMYAIFDPTQLKKPEGRTKDIICVKHRSNPSRLDRVSVQGCDTIWKCFKRSVWRNPNGKFLGQREVITKQGFGNIL